MSLNKKLDKMLEAWEKYRHEEIEEAEEFASSQYQNLNQEGEKNESIIY